VLSQYVAVLPIAKTMAQWVERASCSELGGISS
jgi:hypothetical protein